MIKDLLQRSRSYRRFHQERTISEDVLRELVALVRLAPSARNLQPLKFILAANPEMNARIFPHLGWAGDLRGWPGPAAGERPAAYVVILGDNEIRKPAKWDHAIAAQTIMLGAAERGLGGCIMGSIKRMGLRRALNIPPRYQILLVLALGHPAETVVLEEVGADGDIRYWRDENGVHHVPKRPLKELILGQPADALARGD